MLELPVARSPDVPDPVGFARDALVHERGRGAEQVAAAAAVVDPLVDHHLSAPVAIGADFERQPAPRLFRALAARSSTRPGSGAAIDVQQRGRGHDDVRAAQPHAAQLCRAASSARLTERTGVVGAPGVVQAASDAPDCATRALGSARQVEATARTTATPATMRARALDRTPCGRIEMR